LSVYIRGTHLRSARLELGGEVLDFLARRRGDEEAQEQGQERGETHDAHGGTGRRWARSRKSRFFRSNRFLFARFAATRSRVVSNEDSSFTSQRSAGAWRRRDG
jgi:hypothetical protein